ncbi:rhomboid family intramembrane serine protease [Microlunatus flavus]|uniref:Membrane associated serine protease, rhomboid family n=1 Tax=Microlunatus flavus TaxID=1036181 RepID=A0A1H9HLF8_9ACTN|nr:rhomboid family intramembrane serine protease [Microlunatus flavus]SEQ63138.1 Membrane associated serine protease, rhomboid family [Microlunatus flavus]
MTSSPSGPEFAAPGFGACYKHPDRETGIACQRCGRPICGECMNPASVGFQCPRCVGLGRGAVREPRTRFGARVGRGSGGAATKTLMVVLAAVYVLDLVTRGLVQGPLLMWNPAVAGGQLWRLVTSGFVSGSLLGLAMNLLVLYLAGRAIESEVGSARFVALYLAGALGGSTLFYLLGPAGGATIGGASAVVGLLAANAIGKRKSGEDVRGDVALFVILVLYSLLIGFNSFGWLTMIGGIVVGALAGWVLAYAPRTNRAAIQVFGLLAVVGVCLVAVVVPTFVG